jgi:hypothetical protein
MTARRIAIDGDAWDVLPSGRTTVYGRDQIGLVFQQGTGPERRRRYTRFTPVGTRAPDGAIAELSERQLRELFYASQPAWTSPEADYGAG